MTTMTTMTTMRKKKKCNHESQYAGEATINHDCLLIVEGEIDDNNNGEDNEFEE